MQPFWQACGNPLDTPADSTYNQNNIRYTVGQGVKMAEIGGWDRRGPNRCDSKLLQPAVTIPGKYIFKK